MAPLIALVAPIVKALMENGLSTLAGAVVAKGQEWVEEKTGLDLSQAPKATPEQLLAMKQAEMKHEEILLQGQLEGRKLDLQEVMAYLTDTDSARKREVGIMQGPSTPYLNKIITPVLAIAILAGSFGGMMYLLNVVDAEYNPAQRDIILLILGSLISMAVQVVSYYFGSSRGDAANSQALQDVLKRSVSNGLGR